MKRRLSHLVCISGVLLTASIAHSADLDPLLQRLVLCQDSWQDFEKSPAAGKKTGDALDAQFQRDDKKRLHVPRGQVTYLGFPIFELTPESAGMGVGFTITVKAPMDKVRKSFETALGKKLSNCESGDGLTTCMLELAPKRTVMLISPTAKPEVGTVLGCYYEYVK
ncbi:MAG: hypothetical protein ABIR70_04070 [Bryobacteraceae bacterium]